MLFLNDGLLKKDSQSRGYVRFCFTFVLNVPLGRIKKVMKTEFLFRPPFIYDRKDRI
jgi:hypothetical protein